MTGPGSAVTDKTPVLNKCRSAAALTPPARQAHLAVLASFVRTGQAPSRAVLEGVAGATGARPDAVLAELAERDVVAFDPDGEIRAAYPFSPRPTPIRVTWQGGPVNHAMCAIDALGISAMLGIPVTITAGEPGTGRRITVRADRDRARWEPRRAVVFAGGYRGGCGPSADRACGFINFFVSKKAALAWAAQQPAIRGAVMGQAKALARGIAEFGALMQEAPAPGRE